MPCIETKVNITISKEKEEAMIRDFGKSIGALDGKTENWLMLSFEDNCRLAFKGKTDMPIAFVEVKFYGSANSSSCEKMSEAIFAILKKELDIDPANAYVKYEATENWGWNGRNF